jgi:hypothetical protein
MPTAHLCANVGQQIRAVEKGTADLGAQGAKLCSAAADFVSECKRAAMFGCVSVCVGAARCAAHGRLLATEDVCCAAQQPWNPAGSKASAV